MNPANIVQCLSELVITKLKLHPTTITQNEREMAQHLSETITSLNTCKQNKYEEETTLDLDNGFDPYTDSEEEEEGEELHEGMKFLTIFELEK
jgi:hypothetical protein